MMIWYAISFLAGALFMWKAGFWLLNRTLSQGRYLIESLQGLSPDSFSRLQKAVDNEATRRSEQR